MNAPQWRYVRSGYGSRCADFDIVNETGGRVASTPYEDKARLIAAAPDLLAALREMVAANVPGHGVPMTDAMREAYITARAAIAKATGDA